MKENRHTPTRLPWIMQEKGVVSHQPLKLPTARKNSLLSYLSLITDHWVTDHWSLVIDSLSFTVLWVV